MGLILREVKALIQDCEDNKRYLRRESEIIHEERKCYQKLKDLMGVIEFDQENGGGNPNNGNESGSRSDSRQAEKV